MSGGMTIRELITSWGFVVDDKAIDVAEKKLRRIMTTADKTGDEAPKALARPVNAISMIGEAAAAARRDILWMMGAFTAGSFALGGFFRLAGSMEQTEIAFETMIGDAEKARKTLAELKEFSRTTPFNFANTSELSKRLLAFSFQAEELIPTMTALGNIAAGVGKEKLPQLVLALGQVKAAGKLRGSELRQFTEAGVPLIAELAKTLKVADSQVQDMVENGKVGFNEVWMALQAVTSEGGRFNNLMKRQSGSLLGIFSNLVDTVQLLAVDLGKRGLLGRAKEFLLGILNIIETNRKEILEGMAHAVDMVVGGLEKLISIAKGAWRVFQGLAQVVGGTRRALDLLAKGLFLLASARMLFHLGKMTQGVVDLAKAFLGLGNAALAAQLKIGATALAIGLAIAGVALIIEDIVGYFQGRKSITGLILKDIDRLGDGFAKILNPIFEKLKKFGSEFGQSLVEGLEALSDADWERVGKGILKGLEIIMRIAAIPVMIGGAIAEGIIEGLEKGLREKFPKIAAMLGISEEKEGIENYKLPSKIDFKKDPSFMDFLSGLVSFSTGRSPASASVSGSLIPAPGVPGAGRTKIDATIQVNVPPGTPAEIARAAREGAREGIKALGERELREANRSTESPIER